MVLSSKVIMPIVGQYSGKSSALNRYWSSRLGRQSVHTCRVLSQDQKNEEASSSAGVAEGSAPTKGGFIKAMAKLEGHESFAKMLRNSPFMQMGDPHGKIVEGTIVHVVDDDLYIDFGSKFNCVCPRPPKNGSAFTLGKKVRILIHDLELSTRFLGAKTDLTILEADCNLLGLAGKANPNQPPST